MKKLLLFLIVIYGCMPVSAQEKSVVDLSASIDKLLSGRFKPEEPGLSILVAKVGQIVYRNAFGAANLELNVPMKADMLFNIGSVTKQFTAIAILQLMESGKLSLQDSIQRFIPQFPAKPYKITIENLLTHTSGIPDYMQMNDEDLYLERRDFKPSELIEYFKNEPLEFKPGTRYRYSNSGYVLLGYIIEQISGASYEKYLQENIFNKLKLNNTYYDHASRILSNRTNGYKKGSIYEKADYWGSSLPFAVGGLVSNVDDLWIWHQGLLSGKLIKKQNLEKAFTPSVLNDGSSINYGYGWIINHSADSKVISHGGAITGYRATQVYFQDKDAYIIILANCDQAPVDELSAMISGLILGKPLQTALEQNDPTLSRYVGVYALSEDPKRTIEILKENGRLTAKTSDGQKLQMIFQSERSFEFQDILDAKGEFIIEENKTQGFVIHQNGTYTWKKIK